MSRATASNPTRADFCAGLEVGDSFFSLHLVYAVRRRHDRGRSVRVRWHDRNSGLLDVGGDLCLLVRAFVCNPRPRPARGSARCPCSDALAFLKRILLDSKIGFLHYVQEKYTTLRHEIRGDHARTTTDADASQNDQRQSW